MENILEIETTTTELPTTTTTMEPTTMPPIVILVDDQPAPANTSVAPKTRKKGRRGRKRLPRSPRRGRPTRKRFRSRPRLAYMKAFLHDAHPTEGLRQRCIERIFTPGCNWEFSPAKRIFRLHSPYVEEEGFIQPLFTPVSLSIIVVK